MQQNAIKLILQGHSQNGIAKRQKLHKNEVRAMAIEQLNPALCVFKINILLMVSITRANDDIEFRTFG